MEFQLNERIAVRLKDDPDKVARIVIGARCELHDVFFIVADAAGNFLEWPMNDCLINCLITVDPEPSPLLEELELVEEQVAETPAAEQSPPDKKSRKRKDRAPE